MKLLAIDVSDTELNCEADLGVCIRKPFREL